MKEKIRKEFEKLSRKGIVTAKPAKVISVERTECTVQELREEDIQIEGVNLRAVIDENTNGWLVEPKVDSFVLIAPLENEEGDYYITMFSEIEKITLTIEDMIFVASKDGFIFNGGALGGLIKLEEFRVQIQKNNEILTALLNVLTGTSISEAGNGAASALQAALKTALSGKEVGNFGSNIENDKVKH